ncbi:hypothetical protein HNR01_004915 [Methylorubrum rhodesianum]|jgi:hypothetical protein|nr:hypothetical protein [Methylorubrum rhodesianum]
MLLRTTRMQAVFSVRSERMLIEPIDCNPLLGWFWAWRSMRRSGAKSILVRSGIIPCGDRLRECRFARVTDQNRARGAIRQLGLLGASSNG